MELDDFFLKELCFCRLQNEIEIYKINENELKEQSFALAKVANLLYECPVCFETDILEEEMSPCMGDRSHLFCSECIKR